MLWDDLVIIKSLITVKLNLIKCNYLLKYMKAYLKSPSAVIVLTVIMFIMRLHGVRLEDNNGNQCRVIYLKTYLVVLDWDDVVEVFAVCAFLISMFCSILVFTNVFGKQHFLYAYF